MDNFLFVMSGDPDKDTKTASGIRRTNRYISEGMCANGCAPLKWTDPHNGDCPKCGFHLRTNVPYDG